jgi:hypothetical protein
MDKTAQHGEEFAGPAVGRNGQAWTPPRPLRFATARAEFLNGPGADGADQS